MANPDTGPKPAEEPTPKVEPLTTDIYKETNKDKEEEEEEKKRKEEEETQKRKEEEEEKKRKEEEDQRQLDTVVNQIDELNDPEQSTDDTENGEEGTSAEQPATNSPETETETALKAATPPTFKQRFSNVGKLFAEKKLMDGFIELWNVATDAMSSFQDSLARSLGNANNSPQFLIDMVGQDKYTFQKMFGNLHALGIKVVNPDGSAVEKLQSAAFINLYATTNGVGLERFVNTVQEKIKSSANGKNPPEFTLKELLTITQTVAKDIKPDPEPEAEKEAPTEVAEATETIKVAEEKVTEAKEAVKEAEEKVKEAKEAATEKPNDTALETAVTEAEEALTKAQEKVKFAETELKTAKKDTE